MQRGPLRYDAGPRFRAGHHQAEIGRLQLTPTAELHDLGAGIDGAQTLALPRTKQKSQQPQLERANLVCTSPRRHAETLASQTTASLMRPCRVFPAAACLGKPGPSLH